MGKIFDFSQNVLSKKLIQDGKKNDDDLNIFHNELNVSNDLDKHQKTLEHMAGFYDVINFINKNIYDASKLLIEDNIIYLDTIASKYFYIGKPFEEKRLYMDKGELKEKIIKHKPFITCKYDFIHLIDWEICYVYGNYMYLVAPNKNIDSMMYHNFKYFTLAIYCDMTNKFENFKNYAEIDFRKIKFEIYSDTNENEEEIQKATMYVEHRNVEKTVKIMFLNENNKHLIKNYSNKENKMEHERYIKLLKNQAEHNMNKYLSPFAGLYNSLNINIDNPHYKPENENENK